jgi:hypothetical protein
MGIARESPAPSFHPVSRLARVIAAARPARALIAGLAALSVASGALGAVTPHRPPARPPAVSTAAVSTAGVSAVAVSAVAVRNAAARGSAGAITAAADVKKGVGAWAFDGVSQALADSGASWYYTWSPSHPDVSTPSGVQFVPMIWGSADVNSTALSQAGQYGNVLLGFNEPDNANQSNLSVSTALGLWPRLMATGLTLGSPAVTTGGAAPGGWLDQFMKGASARRYRVNFIALHWYGSNFATAAAVSQLKTYLQGVHARYHLPIWLTEFALANWSSGTFPSNGQQAAFLTAALPMLQGLSYVPRYAWFALPVDSAYGNTGLFGSGPAVTMVGQAYEAAP